MGIFARDTGAEREAAREEASTLPTCTVQVADHGRPVDRPLSPHEAAKMPGSPSGPVTTSHSMPPPPHDVNVQPNSCS
jgi:hypothetical protein